MKAKGEYRDRADPEVAVLDALADRHEDGMTVFELRSRVDLDIDTLEESLSELKADDLIEVTEESDRTVIRPDEAVVGTDVNDGDETGVLDEIRRRLPF
jgi:DNA-binding transcriptional ArsR family regulator